MGAPTIAAAVELDRLDLERGWTSEDRDAVEARCAAHARGRGHDIFNVGDVAFIVKTRCEALPRRSPAMLEPPQAAREHEEMRAAVLELVDPEYADVDEAGQLALGVAGEQRAIPGLARARTTTEED